MASEKSSSSWWSTLPGVITALTGLLTAIGGLYLAIYPSRAETSKVSSNDPPRISEPASHETARANKAVVKPTVLTNVAATEEAGNPSGSTEPVADPQSQSSGTSAAAKIGALAGGKAPTLKSFTHVVRQGDFVLHYDTNSGAAEVLQGSGNALTSLKPYAAGTFSAGWTHLVSCPTGILFYNRNTGSAAFGHIADDGTFSTVKSYPSRAFTPGWTNIVGTPNGILFYNSSDGSGVIGRIDDSGTLINLKTYRAGGFAPGWESIEYRDGSLYYTNYRTGAKAVGYIDSSGNHITR